MASKAIVGGLGVAVGLAAGYLVTVGIFNSRASEDTNIVLGRGTSNVCDVISKENVLKRAPGKKVKWWIRDYQCGRDDVIVTVGNFRTTEQSGNPDNCANATEGGTAWPFEDSEDVQYRRAGRNNKIELKLKDTGLSPHYYFDICFGSDKQDKADPQLVIDPN